MMSCHLHVPSLFTQGEIRKFYSDYILNTRRFGEKIKSIRELHLAGRTRIKHVKRIIASFEKLYQTPAQPKRKFCIWYMLSSRKARVILNGRQVCQGWESYGLQAQDFQVDFVLNLIGKLINQWASWKA